MPVDISNTPPLRLNPNQELRFTRPETELYVGQVLKAVVVKSLSESQVLININGENINAQTSQHIEPGELLQVKVIQSDEDPIVLQILKDNSPLTPLAAELARTLPRQASATQLLASLYELSHAINLPTALKQQINQFLASISSVSQLPQQLAQAIANSGLFWEAALLNWRRNKSSGLQTDFKGQCLRLLAALIEEGAMTPSTHTSNEQRESLLLPGAIPQPLPQASAQSFSGQALSTVLASLREQTEQVLARIKTGQLNNLLQPEGQPYSIMLDLPLGTNRGFDLIALSIKEERQGTPFPSSSWSISFALNLPELGDIQARVKINELAIDVQINAEKQETLILLEANQSIFDNLMANLGLTLRLWNLQLGLEKQNIEGSNLRLLDIRI
ncbi:Flagellar hook-length control protein FliK [Legionella massiliensis]|uniref:Flagellar hook-length control protein FliK n=1 Tax=Legionella massiliensis TaxID=1034943 RepID=A0A078KVK9_9GAMM|nr:flagellar hook-length control protein FliK [Legionella massiliensis]CDZ75809.1 Flagellar hook-length control protein FliK [Legionella massiliensis]CEE11547.1 Flagellar hook-length control protein FliK [Legionella massiliensis]